ncbi:MAG: VOC family protein [Amnibacterium sp.]
MASVLTALEFSSRPGLADWRVLHAGPTARFRTASMADGARLAAAIAPVADRAAVPVDVDLRTDAVTVRLPVRRNAEMDEGHAATASAVSAAAAGLGLTADPVPVQSVQVALDAEDVGAVTRFWSAALGYESDGHHLYDPQRLNPTLFVQEKAWRAPRNRFHVDVSVPHDRAEQRIKAVLAAGGRLLGDRSAPSWWSLIDVEGNVADVATWQEAAD